MRVTSDVDMALMSRDWSSASSRNATMRVRSNSWFSSLAAKAKLPARSAPSGLARVETFPESLDRGLQRR